MGRPGWAKVPVVVERDPQDPFQAKESNGKSTTCCGPMAVLTLTNLAKGFRPMGHNHEVVDVGLDSREEARGLARETHRVGVNGYTHI